MDQNYYTRTAQYLHWIMAIIFIAAWLIGISGSTTLVTIYLMSLAGLALLAICLLKDRTGMPLESRYEEQQNQSPFIWK